MPITIPHPTIKEWLATLDRRGKSRSTRETYRRGVTHFVRWSEQSYGQAFEPAEIIPRDVEEWVAFQQRIEKAAANTVNSRIVSITQYFGWLLKRGLIRQDPTAEVSTKQPKRHKPKALEKEEARLLLRHISKTGHLRDLAIAECLLGAGLRVQELLDLQLGDITLAPRSGQLVVRRGKGALHRVIPLTAKVRRALKAYIEKDAYLAAYREDHPKLKDKTPLWIGERGPLTDRSGIFQMLRKYARLAGLDETKISPHVLRHTFATRYLNRHPGDLRSLAAILGHASIATTMIYTEPALDDLADRMEAADA
jgi:site-specific recombinase XerD